MLLVTAKSPELYEAFCNVTGFGGTTRQATEAPSQILDREITMRFDANSHGLPVSFRPLSQNMTVKVGSHALALYEISNTSDEDVTAIASYNVTPHKVGAYFNKLECFCYDARLIPAGETRKLPVIFFVSPDIEEKTTLSDVRTITLSYTFYSSDDPGVPLPGEIVPGEGNADADLAAAPGDLPVASAG